MNPLPALSWLVVAALLVSQPATQVPTVLFDVNTTSVVESSSGASNFVVLGNSVLFTADTAEFGRELWRMDVATEAVALVKDIKPDTPTSMPTYLVAYAGAVYFAADDGVHGNELWKSDGTAAGTVLVADLVPGPGSAYPREMTVAGGLLYFSASTASGSELWKSDGTAAGTAQVADVEPGPTGSFPIYFTAFGNQLYYQATTSATGAELWKTDGTAAGTVPVVDVVPGPGHGAPNDLTVFGSWLLFGAAGGLWRTDGTATGSVNLHPTRPAEMVACGSNAFFTEATALYVTDGTSANTRLVVDFGGSYPDFLGAPTALGSRVAVQLTRAVTNVMSLWVSDGTATTMVFSQSGANLSARLAVGNLLYFAGTSATGHELWRTDGTTTGTWQVVDIHPTGSSFPGGFTSTPGGRIMFSAADASHGSEPWITDGTAAGTHLVGNIASTAGHTLGSRAADFVDAGGITFFTASTDLAVASTLWRTDGTPAGTSAVVPPGPDRPLSVSALRAVGTKVLFTAVHPQLGNEVWVSDGTAAGTRVLIDVFAGAESGNPTGMVVAEDWLYFLAWNPAIGRALWRTDGTPQGTVLVTGPQTIETMQPLGRGLVFSSWVTGLGYEPYFTDGTAAGTVLLGDLAPGFFHSNPDWLVTLGDRCFFTAHQGAAIFATDGTPAGTGVFLDFVPGTADHFERLAVVGQTLYFVATTPATGSELWKSDGTVAGTSLVADANPGPASSFFYPLGPFADLYLYQSQTSSTLRSLWRSDGTAAGTFRLTSDEVGPVFATGNREAWFTTVDAAGQELWRTDGTAAGTRRHADLFPGISHGRPGSFALSNGKLLFAAEHPSLGMEPWVMQLGASVHPVGYSCMAAGAAPRLTATSPVLGSTFTMRAYDGPTQGFAVVALSGDTTGSFRLPGLACDLFLAPSAFVLAVSALTNGGFTLTWLLPNDPGLNGFALRTQVLLLPDGSVVGVEVTNALALVLGP